MVFEPSVEVFDKVLWIENKPFCLDSVDGTMLTGKLQLTSTELDHINWPRKEVDEFLGQKPAMRYHIFHSKLWVC